MSAGLHSRRMQGAALPIVLLIAALMLATSAAWFEQSIGSARNAVGMADHLLAFHAADAALMICARNIVTGSTQSMAAGEGEPAGWRSQAVFDANAFAPFASWPASLSSRAPQCLIEAWALTNRADSTDARAYLVTARGFGRNADTQTWLQMQVVIDGDKVEQHWRRVAARPY
jgi:Tfp pilus assembly protein PilX